MRAIPPSVKVVEALIHINYEVGEKGYDARVRGVSTPILADRFLAGESVGVIANDYRMASVQVEDALRWEMLHRSTRVRLVRQAVERGEAK